MERTELGDGPAYTLKGRTDSKVTSESPGPGAYSNATPIKQSAPSYSMRGKTPDKKREDVPGPGAYESVKVSKDGPSYSLGSRRQAQSPMNNPGNI
jgi:hypothetical protein